MFPALMGLAGGVGGAGDRGGLPGMSASSSAEAAIDLGSITTGGFQFVPKSDAINYTALAVAGIVGIALVVGRRGK